MRIRILSIALLVAMVGSSEAADISGVLKNSAGTNVRSYSVAMSGPYDFTTKARNTLREQYAEEQQRILPRIEDIPILSDINEFYQNWRRDVEREKMAKEGRVNMDAFPEKGCSCQGRTALCTVNFKVDKDGFKYDEKVGLSFRLNSDNTVSEAIFVGGFTKWRGNLPTATPGMCFFLKSTPNSDKKEIIAIEPGPEDKRKLPMELALRFDNLKTSSRHLSAKLRAECKAMGSAVTSVPIDSLKLNLPS